jgi:DNA-binding XRE family transcriptional regulator
MLIVRIAKGWTQEEAAYECGTYQQTYFLWESGKSMPHQNSKRAIASGFKIPIEEIFGKEVGKKFVDKPLM